LSPSYGGIMRAAARHRLPRANVGRHLRPRLRLRLRRRRRHQVRQRQIRPRQRVTRRPRLAIAIRLASFAQMPTMECLV
jgi:hypothetical protein